MALQDTPGSGDSHIVPLRIERGAVAEANDGPVGTIEQIVMDRTSGQMSALVIRRSDDGTEFELPARYIEVAESTGNHVRLSVTRRELADNPEMVKPYDPAQYAPVYQGEAMPEAAASRVATQSDQPVVTDIEENAAEMVVSGTEAAAGPEVAPVTGAASATEPGWWTPQSGVAPGGRESLEDTTPTVKLNATQPSTGEAIAGEQQAAPAPEASPTPATTGALMGGKPSTSGMGEKSYVPTSPAPALDTVPTSANLPPYTNEHPDQTNAAGSAGEAAAVAPETPNLAPATDIPQTSAAPGIEPANATPLESSAQHASQADVTELSAAEIGVPPAPEPPALTATTITSPVIEPPTSASLTEPAPAALPTQATTPAQPQVLDDIKDRIPQILLSLGSSPAVLLAFGGLAAGLASGIILRRQTSAPTRTRKAMERAGGSAAATADRTRGQAGAIASQARDAAAQLAQSGQEMLRRAGEGAQAKALDAQAQLPSKSNRLVQRTQDVAAQTREQAKATAAETRKQAAEAGQVAKKRARRTVRRFRWFRRGLALGAAIGVLYAPQPGDQLRSRLANTIEEWRSRIA